VKRVNLGKNYLGIARTIPTISISLCERLLENGGFRDRFRHPFQQRTWPLYPL
jgi:hypothetical protein